MKLVSREDNDWDVIDGRLTVELSRREDGSWMFWGMKFRGQRFGGSQILGPGEFNDWLNVEANKQVVTT
jgi:hypothetical protein